jgi:hypothetical protein
MVGYQILEIFPQHPVVQSMPQLQEVRRFQIGKRFVALGHAINFEDKVYHINFLILSFSYWTPILGCLLFPLCKIIFSWFDTTIFNDVVVVYFVFDFLITCFGSSLFGRDKSTQSFLMFFMLWKIKKRKIIFTNWEYLFLFRDKNCVWS